MTLNAYIRCANLYAESLAKYVLFANAITRTMYTYAFILFLNFIISRGVFICFLALFSLSLSFQRCTSWFSLNTTGKFTVTSIESSRTVKSRGTVSSIGNFPITPAGCARTTSKHVSRIPIVWCYSRTMYTRSMSMALGLCFTIEKIRFYAFRTFKWRIIILIFTIR